MALPDMPCPAKTEACVQHPMIVERHGITRLQPERESGVRRVLALVTVWRPTNPQFAACRQLDTGWRDVERNLAGFQIPVPAAFVPTRRAAAVIAQPEVVDRFGTSVQSTGTPASPELTLAICIRTSAMQVRAVDCRGSASG